MNRILTIIMVLILNMGYSQSSIDYQGRDFHELCHELQTYYDSLILVGDTSLFYEGGPYTQFRKWDSYWASRMAEGGSFEAIGDAKKVAHLSMPARMAGPKSNNDSWHEIGPLDKAASGYQVISSGQIGIGPIRFITFCPTNPDLVLCGANDYGGGLFHIDVSQTDEWTPSGSDDWPKSECQHAVFNTDNPDIWYAATHDIVERIGGIHRRDPSSGGWEMIADETDLGGFWTEIFKLLPVPTDDDKLYAATTDGLYVSTNINTNNPNNVSWMKLNLPPPINDPIFGTYAWKPGQYVYDLEMEPGNDLHLYASVRFEGEYDDGNDVYSVRYWRVLQSFDGGSNWEEIENGPANTWTQGSSGHPQNYENIALETTIAAPDNLFVHFDKIIGSYVDEVWKVESAASPNALWTAKMTSIYQIHGGGHAFGISQYMNGENICVGSYIRYKTLINGSATSYSGNSSNAPQYHVDVEDLVYHPLDEDQVWMAHHGGVSRSFDNGANWAWFGKGLGVADVWEMADSYSEPGFIALGLYHDGSVISDGNYYSGWKPDWHQMGKGDGQHPVIDPVEGNYVYWQAQYNGSSRRSDDHGQSEDAISPGGTDFHSDWIIDREVTSILFTHWIEETSHPREMEIKRTLNRGDDWEVVSDFSSIINGTEGNNGKDVWKMYKPYSHPEQLVVQLNFKNIDLPDVKRLMRISNSRTSAAFMQDMDNWEELQLPTVLREEDGNPGVFIDHVKNGSLAIADVAFDNNDPNIVYIAYSPAVYASNSATGTEMLFRMNYNLPDTDPNYQTDLTGTTANALPNVGMGWDVLAIERGSNGGIYLATDLGVFYTNNELWASGDEWVPFGTGLPHGNCHGIEINYQINKLRVAMPGRGVWEHDLYCPSLLNATESGTYSSDLFLEVKEDISSTAIVPVAQDVAYRGGAYIDLAPGFHAEAGADFHAFIHGCDSPGNSFKHGSTDGTVSGTNKKDLSSNKIAIYPNPTEGQFNVESNDDVCIDKIELLDLTGRNFDVSYRSLNTCSIVECSTSFNVSTGTYIVVATLSTGERYSSKLILK